jgi:Inner membrane protein YgaP-like, transmembrane domain
MMTRNEHTIDRVARIVLAFAIFAAALATTPWLAAIGVILLATGLMGWCPIYRVLGISTCRVASHN